MNRWLLGGQSARSPEAQSLDLIQRATKKRAALDPSKLLRAMQLSDNADPIRSNQAFQMLSGVLQEARFFQKLDQPRKSNLLREVKSVLKCDRYDAQQIERLGEYQAELSTLSRSDYVAASDLLVSVLGPERFRRHGSAEGGRDRLHLNETIGALLNQWDRLTADNKIGFLAFYERAAQRLTVASHRERLSLCFALLQAVLSDKAGLDVGVDVAHPSGNSTVEVCLERLADLGGYSVDLVQRLFYLPEAKRLTFIDLLTLFNPFDAFSKEAVAEVLSAVLASSPNPLKSLLQEGREGLDIEPIGPTASNILDQLRQHCMARLGDGSGDAGLIDTITRLPVGAWGDFLEVYRALDPAHRATRLAQVQPVLENGAGPVDANPSWLLSLALGSPTLALREAFECLPPEKRSTVAAVLAPLSSLKGVDDWALRWVPDWGQLNDWGQLKDVPRDRLVKGAEEVMRLMSMPSLQATFTPEAWDPLVRRVMLADVPMDRLSAALQSLVALRSLSVTLFDALLSLPVAHQPLVVAALQRSGLQNGQQQSAFIESMHAMPVESFDAYAEFCRLMGGQNPVAAARRGRYRVASRHVGATPFENPFLPLRRLFDDVPPAMRRDVTAMITRVDQHFKTVDATAKVALFNRMAVSNRSITSLATIVETLLKVIEAREPLPDGKLAFLQFQSLLETVLSGNDDNLQAVAAVLPYVGPSADLPRVLQQLMGTAPEKLSLYVTQAMRFERPDIEVFMALFDDYAPEKIEPLVSMAIELGFKEADRFQSIAQVPIDQRSRFMEAVRSGLPTRYIPADYLALMVARAPGDWQPFAQALSRMAQLFGHLSSTERALVGALSPNERTLFIQTAADYIGAEDRQGASADSDASNDHVGHRSVERLASAHRSSMKLKAFPALLALCTGESMVLRRHLFELLRTISKRLLLGDFEAKMDLIDQVLRLDQRAPLRLEKCRQALGLVETGLKLVDQGRLASQRDVLFQLLALMATLEGGQFSPFMDAVAQCVGSDKPTLKFLQAMRSVPDGEWQAFAQLHRELGPLAEHFAHRLVSVDTEDRTVVAAMLIELFSNEVRSPRSDVAPALDVSHLDALLLHLSQREPVERPQLVTFLRTLNRSLPELTVASKLSIEAALVASHEPLYSVMKRVDEALALIDSARYDSEAGGQLIQLIIEHGSDDLDTLFTQMNRLGPFDRNVYAVLIRQQGRQPLAPLVDDAILLGVHRSANDFRQLAALAPNQRMQLIAAARTVVGWNNEVETVWLLNAVPEAQWVETIAMANRLVGRYPALNNPGLIHQLLPLPQEERRHLEAVIQPIGRDRLDLPMLQTILAQPRATREAFVERRLEALFHQQGQADIRQVYANVRDNVHATGRMDKTRTSFVRLIQRCPAPSERESAKILQSVVAEIKALQRSRPNAAPYRRALETLQRPYRPSDYTRALITNPDYRSGLPGLGQMAALVRLMIRDYRADNTVDAHLDGERDNLTISFVTALGECIETDGHRVCSTGVSQRLISVLQGYYPEIEIDQVERTPTNQYFAQLCSQYNRRYPDEGIDERQADFYQYAVQEGKSYYGERSAEYDDFVRNQLDEFYEQSGYSKEAAVPDVPNCD